MPVETRNCLVRDNMQEQIDAKEQNAYLLLDTIQSQVRRGGYGDAACYCHVLQRTLESVNEIANELADMEDDG